LTGQTQLVATRPSTDIAFEREFGITVASLFTSAPVGMVVNGVIVDQAAALRWLGDMKSEHSCFLAWHASRAPQPFDDWIETVDAVDWKFSKQADPTPPVQPANSSALSLP
jgi:hypothetical protein